ncbi:uncharacterized protein DNG_03227 [Cephalotrichum gorgonifer]|uniref:DUF7136 domain-containing protein n=1 Tax=Cephalotrichum gorgonifer TaxID=2041049 RepID=A0AAE8SU21_9PEZI|nr:uncharacterized protein DNG_03227 [Cephalotrichum gorgonifer]
MRLHSLLLASALSLFPAVRALNYPATVTLGLVFPKNKTYNSDITNFPVVLAVNNAEAAFDWGWTLSWRIWGPNGTISIPATGTAYQSGSEKPPPGVGDVWVISDTDDTVVNLEPGKYRLEWEWDSTSCIDTDVILTINEGIAATGNVNFTIVGDGSGAPLSLTDGCPVFQSRVHAGRATDWGLASAESISVTPHEQFSSSVGVLGCFINTNRVAYFPSFPSCQKPCLRIKDKENGREVTVLHIDSSAGAYDISYDAWNYLKTGKSAKDDPQQGNGIEVETEQLSIDDESCKALLSETNGKLPIMAKSPQWGLECPDDVEFYNIGTSTCTIGKNEKCEVSGDQVKCPSGDSAATEELEGMAVQNIEYGTGKVVEAQ